jgi:hypothetical protein
MERVGSAAWIGDGLNLRGKIIALGSIRANALSPDKSIERHYNGNLNNSDYGGYLLIGITR